MESVAWPDDLGNRPDRPSVDQLRDVLKSFPTGTGQSFDFVSPRSFEHLSDEGIEALIWRSMALTDQPHCFHF